MTNVLKIEQNYFISKVRVSSWVQRYIQNEK